MIPGASVIYEKQKLTKNEQTGPDLTRFFKSLAIEKYSNFVYDEENRKDQTWTETFTTLSSFRQYRKTR